MGTQLTDRKLKDLVTMTLDDIETKDFTSIAQELTDYEALPRIFRKDMKTQKGGVGAQWNLMYRNGGGYRKVGLHDTDVLSQIDIWTKARIDWARRGTSWFVELAELNENVGKDEALVDLLEGKEHAAMLGMAEGLEDEWFGTPDPSDDNFIPSLFYYIVRGTTDGFTGMNPAGFASVAGIDSSAAKFSKYRNYSFRYLNATADSLMTWLGRAFRHTRWVCPTNVGSFRKFAGQQFRLQTNEYVIERMEKALRMQNDNLGPDLLKYDGETTVKRTPVQYIPKLDEQPDNPIIGTNYNVLEPLALEGEKFRRTDPEWLKGVQHRTMAVWIDLAVLVKCFDRRRLFIGYQNAGADL